jgi:DNA-binding HxlR family transcriptional regulator
LEIIEALKESKKRWSVLERIVGDKRILKERLDALIEYKLIEVEVIPDTPKRGTKYYKLTPFGELCFRRYMSLRRSSKIEIRILRITILLAESHDFPSLLPLTCV